MLTRNKIKLIKSLKYKKFREKENLFVCEGKKIVELLLTSHFEIVEIFALRSFAEKHSKYTISEISEAELNKISFLKTPQEVLALVKIPKVSVDELVFDKKISLVLDKIQDPGNLGTIVRIADWFGIENIICSTDTVDLYSPKTVQATMGSIFSVNVYYAELKSFLSRFKHITVYGAFMEGKNIYTADLSSTAFVVVGNEGNGISTEIEKFITERLTIPSFNKTRKAESLNVAIATSIICSEFSRRLL